MKSITLTLAYVLATACLLSALVRSEVTENVISAESNYQEEESFQSGGGQPAAVGVAAELSASSSSSSSNNRSSSSSSASSTTGDAPAPPTPAPAPPTPAPAPPTPAPIPPTPAPVVTGSPPTSTPETNQPASTTPGPTYKYSGLFTVTLISGESGASAQAEISETLWTKLNITRAQIGFSEIDSQPGTMSFVIREEDETTAKAIAILQQAASGDTAEQEALGFSAISSGAAVNDDNKADQSGLSAGVIAVIVIGSLVIVVLVAGVVFKVSQSGRTVGHDRHIESMDEELSPSRREALLNADAARV